MRLKLLSILIVLGAIYSPALKASPFCSQALLNSGLLESTKANESSEKNLKKFEQIFNRSRGLFSYQSALGSQFKAKLAALMQAGGHYLDSGSGDGVAAREFLEGSRGATRASIVSLENSLNSNSRLKVFKGRFLEEIPALEFEPADLITDVFGPLAYSAAPHLILRKYLQILKDNGELYIFLGSHDEIYGRENFVVTADGRYLSLLEWIQGLSGLKVEMTRTVRDDEGTLIEKLSLKISKDLSRPLEIPSVELVNFKEGAPPKMFFKEERGTQGLSALRLQAIQLQNFTFLQEAFAGMTFTKFLDSFRSGEISNPLLSSIKGLSKGELWLNISPFGENLKSSFSAKEYEAENTEVFSGLSQKWMRWQVGQVQPAKFAYQQRSHLESLPGQQKAQLLTDFYGDFVTSLRPDEVLRRYLAGSEKDADIFIFLGPEYGGFGSASKIICRDGTTRTLRQWLGNLPGLKTQLYRGGYAWATGQWTFVKINKQSTFAKIPNLRFLGVSTVAQEQRDQMSPLVKVFEETD